MARSNWYSDHPPACTCARCDRERRSGRRKPPPRSPGSPGRQSSEGAQFLGGLLVLGIIAFAGMWWFWWDPAYSFARSAVGQPPPTPESIAAIDRAEVEWWVVLLSNKARTESGLPRLQHSPRISEIARQHSRRMMSRGQQFHARRAVSSCGLAENIVHHHRARSYSGSTAVGWANSEEVARRLVRSWMNSPGHRDNILNPKYRTIGVGVALGLDADREPPRQTIWATQNFSSC